MSGRVHLPPLTGSGGVPVSALVRDPDSSSDDDSASTATGGSGASDNECPKCMVKGSLRLCCNEYLCDRCYYRFDLCPRCGQPTDVDRIDTSDEPNPPKHAIAMARGVAWTLVAITFFVVPVTLFMLHGRSIPTLFHGSPCSESTIFGEPRRWTCVTRESIFPPTSDGAALDYSHASPQVPQWTRCARDNGTNTVRQNGCVCSETCAVDTCLFHASGGEAGWDFVASDFNDGQVVLHDTFRPAPSAEQWSLLTGDTLSSRCSSALGGPTLRFKGGITRRAETVDLDMRFGGTVEFFLVYGNGTLGCAEYFNDGVTLAYSTDGGGTWTDITTFARVEYLLTFHPRMRKVFLRIPEGAWSPHVRFAFYQQAFWADFDNFALDDLRITASIATGWADSSTFIGFQDRVRRATVDAACCLDCDSCPQPHRIENRSACAATPGFGAPAPAAESEDAADTEATAATAAAVAGAFAGQTRAGVYPVHTAQAHEYVLLGAAVVSMPAALHCVLRPFLAGAARLRECWTRHARAAAARQRAKDKAERRARRKAEAAAAEEAARLAALNRKKTIGAKVLPRHRQRELAHEMGNGGSLVDDSMATTATAATTATTASGASGGRQQALAPLKQTRDHSHGNLASLAQGGHRPGSRRHVGSAGARQRPVSAGSHQRAVATAANTKANRGASTKAETLEMVASLGSAAGDDEGGPTGASGLDSAAGAGASASVDSGTADGKKGKGKGKGKRKGSRGGLARLSSGLGRSLRRGASLLSGTTNSSGDDDGAGQRWEDGSDADAPPPGSRPTSFVRKKRRLPRDELAGKLAKKAVPRDEFEDVSPALPGARLHTFGPAFELWWWVLCLLLGALLPLAIAYQLWQGQAPYVHEALRLNLRVTTVNANVWAVSLAAIVADAPAYGAMVTDVLGVVPGLRPSATLATPSLREACAALAVPEGATLGGMEIMRRRALAVLGGDSQTRTRFRVAAIRQLWRLPRPAVVGLALVVMVACMPWAMVAATLQHNNRVLASVCACFAALRAFAGPTVLLRVALTYHEILRVLPRYDWLVAAKPEDARPSRRAADAVCGSRCRGGALLCTLAGLPVCFSAAAGLVWAGHLGWTHWPDVDEETAAAACVAAFFASWLLCALYGAYAGAMRGLHVSPLLALTSTKGALMMHVWRPRGSELLAGVRCWTNPRSRWGRLLSTLLGCVASELIPNPSDAVLLVYSPKRTRRLRLLTDAPLALQDLRYRTKMLGSAYESPEPATGSDDDDDASDDDSQLLLACIGRGKRGRRLPRAASGRVLPTGAGAGGAATTSNPVAGSPPKRPGDGGDADGEGSSSGSDSGSDVDSRRRRRSGKGAVEHGDRHDGHSDGHIELNWDPSDFGARLGRLNAGSLRVLSTARVQAGSGTARQSGSGRSVR